MNKKAQRSSLLHERLVSRDPPYRVYVHVTILTGFIFEDSRQSCENATS